MAASQSTNPDPVTLPHVHFEKADDLLRSAANLRVEEDRLRIRADKIDANAKELEGSAIALRVEGEKLRTSADKIDASAQELETSAAELQAIAEENRDHVQAELDSTLDYHDDVLNNFLATPKNHKAVKDLTTNVEEGRAYVHEVINLGERLLTFRAGEVGMEPVAGQENENDLDGLKISDHDLDGMVSPSLPFIHAPLLDTESEDQEYGSRTQSKSKKSKKSKQRKRKKTVADENDLADRTWAHVAPSPTAQEQSLSLVGNEEDWITNTQIATTWPKELKRKKSGKDSSSDVKRPKIQSPPAQEKAESKAAYMKRIIRSSKREKKMARLGLD